MSKIREILTPMLIESQKQSEREWMMVRVVQAVGQLDINLNVMRVMTQLIIEQCDRVLEQSNFASWSGTPSNVASDIKQRAVVMLRLLDGEVVV